jgi:hypothetical protein
MTRAVNILPSTYHSRSLSLQGPDTSNKLLPSDPPIEDQGLIKDVLEVKTLPKQTVTTYVLVC